MDLDCFLEVSWPAADTLLLENICIGIVCSVAELKTFLFEVDLLANTWCVTVGLWNALAIYLARPPPHDFCTNFVVEAAQPIRSLHVNKPTFVQAQSSSPSDWRRCEWTSTVQMACKSVNELLKRLMGVAEVSVVVFFFPRKG